MNEIAHIGLDFKRALCTDLYPVGFGFRSHKPDGAVSFKSKGHGCMMPLVFSAARGKTVAFDEATTGWPCSAFYLGYADWIFPGIEYYLSDGPIGRDCERFVASPELAKTYLESVRIEPRSSGVAVFEPLEKTRDDQAPEVVIFFADADRLSALVFLAQYANPMEEHCVVTRFASACGAVVTLPLRHARRNELKLVWGMHDISARARLPKDLMTLAMPFAMAQRMHGHINGSFLGTKPWATLAGRHQEVQED